VAVPRLDPQVEVLLQADEGGVPVEELTAEEARASAARLYAEQFGEVDDVHSVEDLDANGVPVRVYRPVETDEPSPALVYFHGGGWVTGNLDTHAGIARAFAARTPCVVVAVDYRCAPEHRYPAALEDAWTATKWVAENAEELRLDPLRIGVGGDSAGGTLATVVGRMGRDHAVPLAAQLLVYPVTSHSFETPSYSLFQLGYGLTREGMRWYWTQYLGEGRDGRSDRDISPASLDDLRRLPRAIVITAEADVLRDEAEAYAQRLFLAGVETEGYRYDGMIHGFLRMAGVVDRSQQALTEIADSLREALAKGYET
jgi:acetyl esterase/lipase